MFINFWHAGETSHVSSSLSSSKQVLHSFEEEMALKNIIPRSSKKDTTEYVFEGSVKASIRSGKRNIGVMTRSMTQVASYITINNKF